MYFITFYKCGITLFTSRRRDLNEMTPYKCSYVMLCHVITSKLLFYALTKRGNTIKVLKDMSGHNCLVIMIGIHEDRLAYYW